MGNELVRGTIFVDLDGCIVYHNHEQGNTADLFLPGAVDTLKEWSKTNDLVLTTNREPMNCARIVAQLGYQGVVFKDIVCGLSTGPRMLINDHVFGKPVKATAYPVIRNRGLDGLSF